MSKVSNPFGMKAKDFHLQSDPPSQSLDGFSSRIRGSR
ncbi:unnamed protein product [Brassica rapa subsp. narinosa]